MGVTPGLPIVSGPVQTSVSVPVHWSPLTTPVMASWHSGVVLGTKLAEAALFVTVPVIEPPDVPSHVKVPESEEPL
jgi:hypothetical protein